MKIIILILALCLACGPAFSQTIESNRLPLTAEKWDFKPDKVKFSTKNDSPQMQIQPDAGKVLAKNLDFSTGIIEFDVNPKDFITFYFRYQNAKENECFYFLNGQLAYLDKNLQGSPTEKPPGGRVSIENTSFVLPLKAGDNELLVGVANDAAWGWGAVARLESLEGVEISPDPTFDSRLVKISDELLDAYVGTFKLSTGEDVTVTKESVGLRFFGKGFIDTMLYPQSGSKFFSRDFDLQFEFSGENKDAITVYNEGKQLMEIKREK